jgi:transposase
MKLNMNPDEIITKKDIKAVTDKLSKGEISKGAAIRALFAGGLSVKEIADITTIRYNHVYNVVNQEVMKNGMENDVIRAREGGTKKSQILTLLGEGKSIKEVSAELGCLYNQVWQVAKDAGLTPKQQAALATAVQEG